MTRVPTLAAHSLMSARLMSTQSRIYDLQTQLSTEKKSQTYSGIASDALRLVSFENISALNQTYITNNTVANTRLSAMSSSVDGARASLINFRDDLSSYLNHDLTNMDDEELTNLKGLQDRAFNILKDIESYFDIKLGDQYLFSGGRNDVLPISIPFDSVEDFQAVYDGNDITAPESRFAHMNDTLITSGDTGTLTFNNGAGTITAGTAGAFNLQTYTNAATGPLTLDATNGTLTAGTAGAFANVEAGMTIQLSGSTADDRFYTVSGVSADGSTLTLAPGLTTDETLAAGATVSVPAIQPGQITVSGTNTNNRTFTVTGISADGRTLTVEPPPVTEAVAATGNAALSNDIYYKGGETVVEHRVSDSRSIELGVNAKNGAIEKAIRAIGMVIQGLPTDSVTGEIDGEELTRRLNEALSIASDAVQHEVGNTAENGQDFSRLENLLASNQVVLKNALTSQQTYSTFLATRMSDMEDADTTEVATMINDQSTALQISYAAMSMINQLSLLNYMD
ncbi:flagellin [Oleispirillum naphthae]|uniref:flagellin n=1 Tax=Oleispirillum naphthae TaxID=2838853 RepID=UPI0030822A1A